MTGLSKTRQAGYRDGRGMNPRVLRLLYEITSRLGVNPALKTADVPDQRLSELVDGPARLEPGRALDLGCGAGRNAIYLARHGWDVTGVDMIDRAIATARAKASAADTSVRFVQDDVARLEELDIGSGYTLIVDSGCYYGLNASQRDAVAAGVTKLAEPGALLVMSGFAKMPGTSAGISAEELRHRFPGWRLQSGTRVPAEEILRHTSISLPLAVALRRGWLEIRRFELVRVTA